ncbi:hypothetical protein [Paenibacillus agricola]|uniref:TrbL/VirB6 plasmid conjugal transfer protein n=1 Tax=Paenibacillus agricola TaxID=2716264 RepID=A0ABX0JBJ0_9BACL|nr:hypothetical protein [Paenibacillus agricola]NHN33141.1 hypothetical protein [Paenibacillus agricola]
MIANRKLIFVLLLIVFLGGVLIPPTTVMAGPLTGMYQHHYLETDPWYAKPILWVLDKILSVFGGIHDPGDHVFYQSCFKDEVGCENKKLGMYTEANYNHVIRRGFALFSIAMAFIVTAAVIKAGMLYSMTPLSSTLKIETTETLIKCMVGIILVGNFFTISGTLFKGNSMIVSLIYQDIKQPIDLSSYGPDLNGSMTSRIPEGDRIVLRDFATEQSGLGKLIVSFATRGVAIWWEVFYLQRFLVISLLLVLAPFWIAMMFYPMLQGITMAAFKELWSQIVAQAIHAGLFWLFFNLFDTNLGWFHVTVAMALFIPISESVRFIFGATSQTGSKLAMIGTAAGMGAFLHMGKAAQDVMGGFSTVKNSASASKGGGAESGSRGSSAGGGGQSVMSQVGGMVGMGGGSSKSPGGSNPPSSNAFASRLRTGGAILGGIGKGSMRFAGAAMGTGLGPAGQFVLGEAGAAVGEAVGYRGGAGIAAAGQGMQSWMRNTKEHFGESSDQNNSESGESSQRYQNADPVTKAFVKSAPVVTSAVSSAFKGMKGGVAEKNDPALRRAGAERAYGAIGEIVGGRGGYEIGEGFAQKLHAGKPLSAGSFQPNQKIYTVETQDGSFLASEEKGQYIRMSNIGKGNSSLNKGQVVVKPYTAHKEHGQPFSIKPMMQASDTRPGTLEEVPPMTFDSEGQSMVHQGKTVNPNDYLEKGRSANSVDLRRRNINISSLSNPSMHSHSKSTSPRQTT